MFVELKAYPGYLIFDTGDVVSLVHGIWRPLTKNKDKKGYLSVNIRPANGRSVRRKIHRLVMEAFTGPSNLEVNHKNGKHFDNNLSNLEYATGSQNVQHSWDTGLRENHRKYLKSRHGEKSSAAKLSNEDAEQILKLKGSGQTTAVVGARFGVSKSQISRIWRGQNRASHLNTPKSKEGVLFSVADIDKVLSYKGVLNSVQTAKLCNMTSAYVRMLWKRVPNYYIKAKASQ